MLKNNKFKTVCMLFCVAALLASCVSAPETTYTDSAAGPSVSAAAPETAYTDPVENPSVSDSDPVESQFVSVSDSDPVESQSVSVSPSDPVEPPSEPAQNPGQKAGIEDEEAPASAPASTSVHAEEEEKPETTYEERLVETLTGLVGLKSKPEKAMKYGLVDMTKDHENYDVDWDYGEDWDAVAWVCSVNGRGWDAVFDAEYYKAAFPMLALQYHYDDEKLLVHFQTVGVHEGRQGCENFNVGAFMDWLDENRPEIREAFQDDYAVYYLYYIGTLDECVGDFQTDGHPAQYKAVLTYAQQKEFDQINYYRHMAGVEDYIFDPELAAFANYRAWVNNDLELVGHTWVHDPNYDDVRRLFYDSLDTHWYSENTLESSAGAPSVWARIAYRRSEAHYNAMIDAESVYVGCSHTYRDRVEYNGSERRVVEFDLFARELTTAMNP